MGTGDSWGTAEELLHPRDSHGRFRSSWKMSGAAVKRTMTVLSGFEPRTFPSDEAAASYTRDLGRRRKSGYGSSTAVPRYLRNAADVNKKLRAGETDSPEVRAMDAAMQPLPEDLILSRSVGPEAFGLKPDGLSRLEEYTGKLVSDRAYGSTNIGTPLTGGQGPRITLVIAAPAGTRAVIPQGQGSREVVLDRDQPLRITKVQSDGQGGYYVLAVAVPKGAKGDTRTKKLGSRAPRPTAPDATDAPVAPTAPVAPSAVPAPGPVAAPVPARTGTRAPAAQPAPRTETVVTESIGSTDHPKRTATDKTEPPVTDDAVQRQRAQTRREIRAERRQRGERSPAPVARETSQQLIERLQAENDAEILKLMGLIGEDLPQNPFLKAFIGITMAKLRRKRTGKASIVAEIRGQRETSSMFKQDPEAQRVLKKLADWLEGTRLRAGGANAFRLDED